MMVIVHSRLTCLVLNLREDTSYFREAVTNRSHLTSPHGHICLSTSVLLAYHRLATTLTPFHRHPLTRCVVGSLSPLSIKATVACLPLGPRPPSSQLTLLYFYSLACSSKCFMTRRLFLWSMSQLSTSLFIREIFWAI
jgi:hypothetical protein